MYIQFFIILILILILIGSIAIIKREFNYFQKYENVRILNYIPISELYDNLKTGDIILFKSHSKSLSSTVLTHVYYTHIGIVIKPNIHSHLHKIPLYTNKEEIPLYISETNPAFEYLPINYKNGNFDDLKPAKYKHDGWRTNNGTDLLPLLIRIKYYPGDSFIMSLNKKLDPNRENLLIKYTKEFCPYPTPIQGLKILMEQKFSNKQKTNARHCYQHVANLLDKINITNNLFSDYGVISICNKLAYIYGEELNDGYMYNTPIKIIYDI
jgi:hypothetical protein